MAFPYTPPHRDPARPSLAARAGVVAFLIPVAVALVAAVALMAGCVAGLVWS